MKCEQARAQLTAYLDGELEGDRGSAVRGHLRGCEGCRDAARDEAALRDGLRALPPVDPPPSLWAGVQQQLAAAEVADADKPRWRRAVARWFAPQQLWLAGAGIAAIVALLVWKTHRSEPAAAPPPAVAHEHVIIAPQHDTPPTPPAPAPAPDEAADVTADLAAAPARETQSYADAASELMKAAQDARATWSEDKKREFDARVAELHAKIDHASDVRTRQQAYRGLIRYLQGAATRDEVALR